MEVENWSGKLSGKTLFRYLGMRGKKINRRWFVLYTWFVTLTFNVC